MAEPIKTDQPNIDAVVKPRADARPLPLADLEDIARQAGMHRAAAYMRAMGMQTPVETAEAEEI